jgi:hypothetical protein
MQKEPTEILDVSTTKHMATAHSFGHAGINQAARGGHGLEQMARRLREWVGSKKCAWCVPGVCLVCAQSENRP